MDDFGPYAVVSRVAVGSTATVYKCRHREIERTAAVKDLHSTLRDSSEFLQQFRVEARLLADFDSEHIVTVFDFVEESTRAWIAEQWIDGTTLETVLVSRGPLNAEQSLGVLRGALLGLSYAHDRGVIHGDLSPANIMVDLFGVSKLIDFGLSAPAGSTGPRGTPAYSSPEAVAGNRVGLSSDVYAAAAVLYTLLTGRPVFPAPTAEAVLHSHLEQPPPALAGYGAEMASLVADSLAKDPARRPPNARAFLERLEGAAAERYGADWLERASVAGAVAATAGAAVLGAAISTSDAPTSAPAVVGAPKAPTSWVNSAASTGRVSRRLGRGAKVALGAGVAAGALGVSLAVALSGNNDDTHPTAVVERSVSSAPRPSKIAPLRSIPSGGKYKLVIRLTSSTFPAERVGSVSTRAWSVTPTCRDKSCVAKIHSSSGSDFSGTFDGSSLSITKTIPVDGPCRYVDGPKKGQVAPKTHFHATQLYRVHLSVARRSAGPVPLAGTAQLLIGVATLVQPPGTVSGNCHNTDRTYRSTYSYTMTYVSS